MVGDLKDLLGALGGSAGEMQQLSVAAFVQKVARDGSGAQKAALKTLLGEAAK